MGLFGSFDENVRMIEEELDVNITARENQIWIEGQEQNVDLAYKVIMQLLAIIKDNQTIDKSKIRYSIELAREGKEELIKEILTDVVCITYKGKQIKYKTLGQKRYVNAIKNNDIVFGIGPAGTGKTYLATSMAVMALKNKEVSRIVLTRPAIEAGERLGFLPGDLQNKVDPYLRPLYDALYDIMGPDNYQKLQEKGVIEVAPLAYMRGRTLDDAFIILDEAQNTTIEQMKMFLTRIGFGSKAVIIGDITQIDLPLGKKSGLKHVMHILSGIEGIDFAYLTHKDVVRHQLVQKIIQAYEKYEKQRSRKEEE
ncbi:MAG TPA: PhoH family protein [Clostridiales bacterium]|nr:PhoH family protein [Clostridiales bacterium]